MAGTFERLDAVTAELKSKKDTLAEVFEAAGPEGDLSKVKGLGETDADRMAGIVELNGSIEQLTAERKQLMGVKRAYDRMQEGDVTADEVSAFKTAKGLGDLFVESAAFKSHQRGRDSQSATLDVNVKTLMETSSGWAPQSERRDRLVEMNFQPLRITDVVPTSTSEAQVIDYWEETTASDNAAATSEGGTYAEAELELTLRTVPMSKITSWLPVTDEQLKYQSRARAHIGGRLGLFVQRETARQVMAGNGTPPNISGFLDRAIQTLAMGTDTLTKRILLAMTKIREEGGEPDAMVINPLDWYTLRTEEDGTGNFALGPATLSGLVNPWGLTPVVTASVSQGTVLVGDFAAHSELIFGQGVDVQVSNSHSDYFIKGKQAIRADLYATLAVYRPAAFCSITGVEAPSES